MTAAAFQATYSDWRIVKGRKVVQVVFELPLESADAAYQALGGMPIAAAEVWCGIARLSSPQRETTPAPVEAMPRPARSLLSAPVGDSKPRRKFEDLTPAQQAGILCGQQNFQLFLNERFHYNAGSSDEAAEAVRELCKVSSRALLTTDNTEWHALQLAFRLWENHPELEDA